MQTIMFLFVFCLGIVSAVSADTITLSLIERQSRYDIVCGQYTYHFWDKTQIEEFANRQDSGDDALTKNVRVAIKADIDSIGIDSFLDSIKTAPKAYEIQ